MLLVPPAFIARQINVVLDDIGADAIKTGMLGDAAAIAAVAAALETRTAVPLVLDPVMASTTGRQFLTDDAIAELKRRLLPLAAVITPNLPEAEVLARMPISDLRSMRHAASALLALGVPAVLVKGGHLPGEDIVDILATSSGIEEFRARRIASRHTHGTGCTLASGIAAGLAQGIALHEAVLRARSYVRQAIASAPGFGAGRGPLNHAVTVCP